MIKKTLAILAALVFFCTNTTAYASFNPTYTGKFTTSSPQCYMTFSDSNAVMTKIVYYYNNSVDRFLTVEDPSSFSFSKDLLNVYYTHDGIYTDLEGNKLGVIQQPIIINTDDITVTLNVLGKVKKVTYVYNGYTYSRTY